MNKARFGLAVIAVSLSVVLLHACGGDDAITSSVEPKTGSTISGDEKIVVTFTGSVDSKSLKLGGSMAADSDKGTWTKTTNKDDTLTLAPISSWNTGDFTIDVDDSGGTALPQIKLQYNVSIKLTTFQAAKVVIGQPNFTDINSDQGGVEAANVIDFPWGRPAYDATTDQLFVSDTSNNRVLVFDSVPTANNQSAKHVIGQADFTAHSNAAAANRLNDPTDIQVYGGKLFVLDRDNARILIFNSIPKSTNPSADVVVGQDVMTNHGNACKANTLGSTVEGMMVAGGKLIVTDSSNNRVLIWNKIPTTNGKAADLVLGQNSFTTCAGNDDDQNNSSDTAPSARTLYFPAGLWSDGEKLVVLDDSNNRALIWNKFPTKNFEKADVVLGQGDFVHSNGNDDNQDSVSDAAPSARTLADPYVGITSNGTQLFITDSDNNRILVWNKFPTKNFQKADVVLGQSDFTHQISNDDNQDGVSDSLASARTFNFPDGLALVGDQLILTDEDNSRFLIFNGK